MFVGGIGGLWLVAGGYGSFVVVVVGGWWWVIDGWELIFCCCESVGL
jgi:hypothetical protein